MWWVALDLSSVMEPCKRQEWKKITKNQRDAYLNRVCHQKEHYFTDKALYWLVSSSTFGLTWCLLMMSLSLLACFCSMSGDKKTVGRVKQLFQKYRNIQLQSLTIFLSKQAGLFLLKQSSLFKQIHKEYLQTAADILIGDTDLFINQQLVCGDYGSYLDQVLLYI